jgi:hypothetical protein
MTGRPPDATASADPARRRDRAWLRGTALVPAVSLVTGLAVLGLWVIATRAGWVKPLFLPAPEAILSAFGQAWTGATVRRSASTSGTASCASSAASGSPPCWGSPPGSPWARAGSPAASSTR